MAAEPFSAAACPAAEARAVECLLVSSSPSAGKRETPDPAALHTKLGPDEKKEVVGCGLFHSLSPAPRE